MKAPCSFNGYFGDATFYPENTIDETPAVWVGHVLGLKRDSIAYQGPTFTALQGDFEKAIVEYINHCKKVGKITEVSKC